MLPWMIDTFLCRGRCVACVSGEDAGEREEPSDLKGEAGAVSKSLLHLEKGQYRRALKRCEQAVLDRMSGATRGWLDNADC